MTALAVVVLGSACSRTPDRPEARPPGGTGDPLRIDPELIASLEAFSACDDLLDYLHTEGAKLVGPYGFGGGAVGFPVDAMARGAATSASPPTTVAEPSAADPDHSSTNVQEEGVDEPDLVKTDGQRLVTWGQGQLRVVDLTGDAPRLAASLPIDDEDGSDAQLLLTRDRVLVLRAVQPQPVPMYRPSPAGDQAVRGGGISAPVPYQAGPARTRVTAVDVSDPGAPHVVETVTLDGSLVAARMVEGVARLVLRSGPVDLPFLFPSGSEASVKVAEEANHRVVAESTLDDWLPGFTVGEGRRQRLTDCDDVRRPDVFSGVGMLTVVSVDASDPRPGPGASVLGAGDTVYASAAHLYVTSSAWTPSGARADSLVTDSTEVHRFDISDGVRTRYEASGRVTGRLLSSYSLSEDGEDLRVATTDESTQESAVTVLRRDGDALAEIGRIGGLGKGERIYAVRFLGDRGYIVTFRQTDPLYVLDLSDPAHPALVGELHIPGYSAYLHPVGDHRLLGIGQDANERGRAQGLQVSLFDVSDPAAPVRLANAVLPQASSEAEFDPHAFLWWARTGLAVIPFQDYGSGRSGAVGFTVAGDAVAELGRVESTDFQPIRRSIVVGDRLLTLSGSGLRSSDLATLTPGPIVAW